MKQSGLGIASLVLGIIGILTTCVAIGIVPCIIALVLSIISLLVEKNKKKGFGIAGLVCSLIGILLFACFILFANKTNTTESENAVVESTESVHDADEDITEELRQSSEQTMEEQDAITISENEEMDVEILAEYTLSDGIGWYTRHFIIVKNNSNETLDISTSSLAYSSDGTMIGAADASFDALGAGCVSVMYEAFETDNEIAYYETALTVSPSKYYESVIQDLAYVQNDIDGGAVFQVTNNGTEPADFVEGYALFFRDGELVGYDSAYFTDDDYEIKPGVTISKQLNEYENYDTIEFYLTGRK